MYQHHFYNERCKLPVGKVVCVGRNYAEHARELGNAVPESPILFMKPAQALRTLEVPIRWPAEFGSCHHEVELAVLIGERAQHIEASQARDYIAGIGLGLDLTLRDLQNQLKAKGQPWELAKAFDGSCPVSAFMLPHEFPDLGSIRLALNINGSRRQAGSSADMITSIPELLAYITRYFTLDPGDVVMTGTPAGVGPLAAGDKIELVLDERFAFYGVVEGGR
jgi:2-keto-4-pentenoate hydratase/2-oxohepta-3-ene-1,7-dioic acid hydratase in catechol pathway